MPNLLRIKLRKQAKPSDTSNVPSPNSALVIKPNSGTISLGSSHERSRLASPKKFIGTSMEKMFPKRKAPKTESKGGTVVEPPRGHLRDHGLVLDVSTPLPLFQPSRWIQEQQETLVENEPLGPLGVPSMPIINGHTLPFDILLPIFTYYASEESIEYPTETLLLVCKHWNVTAMSHRPLWGYFNIHVGHKPTVSRLSRRVRLRLERGGDVVPLYVELRDQLNRSARPFADDTVDPILHMRRTNLYSGHIAPPSCQHTSCICKVNSDRCVRDLLGILSGPNGKHSRRWRRLTLDLSCAWLSDEQTVPIMRALSYPTPSLVSLTLRYLHLGDPTQKFPFLPSTPNLIELSLEDCAFRSIAQTEKLQFAKISWSRTSTSSHDFTYVEPSMGLRSLILNLHRDVVLRVPAELPQLTELQLRGTKLPENMETVFCPSLTHLAIGVHDCSLLEGLLDCYGLPFSRIEHLRIWYEEVDPDKFIRVKWCMRELLSILTNLEALTGDLRMLSVILKLTWQEVPPLIDYFKVGESSTPKRNVNIFEGREITFHLMQEDIHLKLISRPDRRYIVEMARRLGAISPGESWDVISERLSAKWPHP